MQIKIFSKSLSKIDYFLAKFGKVYATGPSPDLVANKLVLCVALNQTKTTSDMAFIDIVSGVIIDRPSVVYQLPTDNVSITVEQLGDY